MPQVPSPTRRSGGPGAPPSPQRRAGGAGGIPLDAAALGTPVSWTNKSGERLAGKLVAAAGGGSKRCVVLCHGLASSKDSALMCALARELSASGFASLRFDFSGNGESQGVFSISGYNKEVADVASAVAHAREALGMEVVAIAGHSKGGTVVLMYSGQYDDVPLVVNIAGRFDCTRGVKERFGEETLTKLERLGQVKLSMASELGSTIDFMLTKRDMAERAAMDMGKLCGKITIGEVLTVHGSEDKIIPLEDAHKFQACIRQHQLSIIDGADHNFRGAVQLQAAIRAIVDFIKAGV